jgi:FkbM family methyltransferase
MKRFVKRVVTDTPLEPMAKGCVRVLRKIGVMPVPAEQLSAEDAWVVDIMKRDLQHDSNCVDVGCSVGKILQYMLQVAPDGTHYAFEPLPHRAAGLRADFPDVRVCDMALSDTSGDAEFHHVVDDSGYSGLRRRKYPSGDMRVEKIMVRVERMDDVIPADLPIHFIKVDVEGAELQMFRGALETIRRNRPLIAFEHGPGASDYYGTTPEDVYDVLVGECGLKISLLPTYLAGGAPLQRGEFRGQYGGEHWYFLAHP